MQVTREAKQKWKNNKPREGVSLTTHLKTDSFFQIPDVNPPVHPPHPTNSLSQSVVGFLSVGADSGFAWAHELML